MAANCTKSNNPLLMWDGTTLYPRDVSIGVEFSFLFEITTTLVADLVVNFVAYSPLTSNANAADTSTVTPELDRPICWMVGTPIIVPGAAQIIIPNGTVAGSLVSANLPNHLRKFAGITISSGNGASVRVCVLNHGLKIGR